MTSSEYENASSIEAQNAQKLSLLRLFSKIHKSETSPLTNEEANNFLKTNGNFEEKFLQKIMKGCVPNEQTTTVGQFIQNLILAYRELKNSNEQLNSAYQQKKKYLEEIEENLKKNENEILNNEGLSNNTIVKIDLFEINLKKKNYEKYSITIKVNDNIYETSHFSPDKKIIENEQFSFKPKTKNDLITFELHGINEENNENNEIGQAFLNLNELNKQEEYEIQLTIPDQENSSRNINEENAAGIIKTKVIFIWSYNDYYKEQLNIENDVYDKIESNLNKTKNYLNQLNSLVPFNDNVNDNNFNHNVNYNFNNGNYALNNNNFNKNNQNQNYNLNNFFKIENLHDINNEYTSDQKYNIYYVLTVWVFVFIMESFSKNNFINGFCIIFTIISITYANKYLNYIIYLIAFSIFFDLIWILFCSTSYWNGKSGFIYFLGALFTVISIATKGVMTFLLLKKNR